MGKKNHWALIGAICGFACFAIGLVIVFWEWYWFEIENIADLIGRWLFFGSLVAVLVVAVGLMAKSRIAVGVGAVLMAVACAMYVVLDVFKIIANIAYDSI